MTNADFTKTSSDQKIAKLGSDKILQLKTLQIEQKDSLIFWVENYFDKMIFKGKVKTKKAKKMDLQKFLTFFANDIGTYHIDNWTPSVSKGFQQLLLSHISKSTGQKYKATTINRIFATLKHCASWIAERRSFAAGNPFEGVKDLMLEEPDWNGLTDRQLMLLRGAIDRRMKICSGKNQNPLLEAAVFFTLLHTGLRKFELCSLTIDQYYNKGFHYIRRKGNMITKRVFLPEDARQKIDEYLKWREDVQDQVNSNFFFINKNYEPLSETAVTRLCQRISRQACVNLTEDEKFILEPHQLRHTCLKRANDKYGMSFAKKISGNIGDRELYRYTAPSQKEVEEKVEGLF
jgi:integrase/recombinase XerD